MKKIFFVLCGLFFLFMTSNAYATKCKATFVSTVNKELELEYFKQRAVEVTSTAATRESLPGNTTTIITVKAKGRSQGNRGDITPRVDITVFYTTATHSKSNLGHIRILAKSTGCKFKFTDFDNSRFSMKKSSISSNFGGQKAQYDISARGNR